MRFSFQAVVATVFLIASGCSFAHGPGGTDTGVRVESLMQADRSWDGTRYQAYPPGAPRLSLLRISIPPDTVLPWHLHPVPNAAYVLSGALVVEKRADGQTRRLQAGDVLAEMVDGAHRGYTGKEGATLIVFYAGGDGVALSTPASQ